jgi:hypothetical protein
MQAPPLAEQRPQLADLPRRDGDRVRVHPGLQLGEQDSLAGQPAGEPGGSHAFYRRHRWRSEGFHGEAKTWHGLARAIRRGLSTMQIQAYLTAAAINLKRLAAALRILWSRLLASPEIPVALPPCLWLAELG